MTIPDPSYITEAELKANTLITALAALDDADVAKLITAAEDHIDKYVGRQPHHPMDSNLVRVFPREQDFSRVGTGSGIAEYPDTPEIPHDVGMACLRQVEWLYQQWWPNRATAPLKHAVTDRSIGGDGSYSESLAGGGVSFVEATLCDQAKVLLDGFRSRWAAIDVTDPRTVPSPR